MDYDAATILSSSLSSTGILRFLTVIALLARTAEAKHFAIISVTHWRHCCPRPVRAAQSEWHAAQATCRDDERVFGVRHLWTVLGAVPRLIGGKGF